ncbi:MAG: imidazole glycerol phosphate synthase subunit HisH [Clostridia bacterium]|nr:imidazole glycerol phosphate synthase subunit HisH [Clostridia bacterium]
MIAIIDYGVGNLFSLSCSFSAIGAETVITGDEAVIKAADRLVLPGVGAFGDAARKLRECGLYDVIKREAENGKPLLGICLGMQLLFERSFEYGIHEGLSLLKGDIVPMEERIDKSLKIPHIGWNKLKFTKDSPLFKYINDGDFVYFVHSYFAENCNDSLAATTDYGKDLTAVVSKGNIFGCQFHPEKSGETGLKILRAFCEMERV